MTHRDAGKDVKDVKELLRTWRNYAETAAVDPYAHGPQATWENGKTSPRHVPS